MNRILLRLLLVISLVMNGVMAPWAMAGGPRSSHHHAEMVAQVSADDGSDCHHGAGHDNAAPQLDHTGHGNGKASTDRSCCDGSTCTCGCLFSPLLARFAMELPFIAWACEPTAEPSTHALVSRAFPPFRPPSV
ncbi:CopL family metal-binding regulatory protein [Tahibacter amnicola]|uniref:CopL family metal-binding regulatory protein n=1 Tax=Tahibacter amnicola TaxID=2976241 RepID=A0ABY6B830_9GAMM|nr:CopL family metal-binding regulatory protein [Tahibacter amnicola]UXI66044.1 CopL family metal-binding regulatory protein [Tahibacter amnicola]